jgi:RNA-directed DNA polymerase
MATSGDFSMAIDTRRINPIVRGWMQYYGAFCRSAISSLLSRINAYLVQWMARAR